GEDLPSCLATGRSRRVRCGRNHAPPRGLRPEPAPFHEAALDALPEPARSRLGSDGERARAVAAGFGSPLVPSGPRLRPAPASVTAARPIVVRREPIFAEAALGAPRAEARHQDPAMKVVLDPSLHRLRIDPQRREQVAPTRTGP